jgi:transcriptional regulator with PAS, ATPase and Fis domain
LAAQAKLLRTLQEMKFRRLGDTSLNEIAFDVTIVAATKPHIKTMIEQGAFLGDLYYRLAKSVLEIPPLRERPEDIRPLAIFFAEKYSRRHNQPRQLHPQLLRELEAYSWPGNVRELEGVIENFVIASPSELIGPEFFRLFIERSSKKESSVPAEPRVNLDMVVKATETDRIIEVLKDSRTIGETAALLGIARTTLNDRVKKLGIDPYQYLAKGKSDGGQ